MAMRIRFRKYLTLGKLFRLNISKSGISATVGVKGASINIGKNGTYLNTGIPGTGIYSREKLPSNRKGNEKGHSEEAIVRAQKALDDYDAKCAEIERRNMKSNIAPNVNLNGLDELFMDIAYFVICEDNPSSSRVKSKFSIDYVRTENIMQQLEENGIISSFSASQGRKVLISMTAFNELKNKLNI